MDMKMNKTTFFGIAAACLVLLGLGMFGLFQQYSFIEGITSISSYMPWGLYISLFLFFEAVGAGALLLAALGKPVSFSRLKLAIIGVVCAACAGLAILPDLGRPLGMWRLFFAPNVASPLLLDVWLLCATLVFGVLLVVGLRFAKPGLVKVAALGSAIFATLLVLGTAIMFCSIPGKIGWESTAEIGISLVQMMLAGCLVALLLKSVFENTRGTVVKISAGLLIANAALMLAEGMLLFYRDDFALNSFEAVMFGPYAILFWAHVVVGLAIPAVLLLMNKGIPVAVGLALAGILLSKFVYVVRGSIYPTYGEISEGLFIPFLQPSTGPQMIQTYIPSVSEFMVAGAVIGLAVLLIMVALNSKLMPADDTAATK
ncbi:MAG: NrfD/PsrC family molybdoenzyme membrane anchor subunit [Gordonibacter sp.]|uniref:NrfD/PsrC family molybdoenzyme membrane anchor subunit n=1 Tax=Gordonibacter sp. TaxID=1968902 RepID=UPI002FC7886E